MIRPLSFCPGLLRADPGRQQQHPVGGEHLDVHADPRAERSLARPRDRAAGRQREAGAGADRPRLAQQRPGDRRGRGGPGRRLRRRAGRQDRRRRHRQDRDAYCARNARRQPGHGSIIRACRCASSALSRASAVLRQPRSGRLLILRVQLVRDRVGEWNGHQHFLSAGGWATVLPPVYCRPASALSPAARMMAAVGAEPQLRVWRKSSGLIRRRSSISCRGSHRRSSTRAQKRLW